MSDNSEDFYVEMTHPKRQILIFPLNQRVSGDGRNIHLQYCMSIFLLDYLLREDKDHL